MENYCVVIYGTKYGGKTFLYNKFRSSARPIIIDIYSKHYENGNSFFNKLKKDVGFKTAFLILNDINDNAYVDTIKIINLYTFLSEEYGRPIVINPGDSFWLDSDIFMDDKTIHKIFLFRDPRLSWIISRGDNNSGDINKYITNYKNHVNLYKQHIDFVCRVDIPTIYDDFPIPDLLDNNLWFENQTTDYDHSLINNLDLTSFDEDLNLLNTTLLPEIKFLNYEQNYTMTDFLLTCQEDIKRIKRCSRKEF